MMLLDNTEKGSNLTGRDQLFSVVRAGVENFPLGVGFGNSNAYIYEHLGKTLSPHNSYLKVILEGGWGFFVGFLILTVMLLVGLNNKISVVFFIAYLIKLMFESMIPFTSSLISVIYLLPYFLGVNENEDSSNAG